MLNEYIKKALHKANYEILSDDDSFYGEIPGFQGVYANAATLEDCRNELAEVLEEWIFFRLTKNLPMPAVDGLQLSVQKIA